MPDCNYCDASFDTEEEELSHLSEAHADELSRIDQRRVDEALGTDDGLIPVDPTVLMVVGVMAGLLGLALFVSFFTGDNTTNPSNAAVGDVAHTPTGGAVHYHGTITVTIDGNRLDFSQSQYQRLDPAFHFENGNGDRWHVHQEGVTLEYALATLGIGVSEGGDVVEFDGQTYRTSDSNTTVEITVDGEAVDPATYVLERGDTIQVVATTGEAG